MTKTLYIIFGQVRAYRKSSQNYKDKLFREGDDILVCCNAYKDKVEEHKKLAKSYRPTWLHIYHKPTEDIRKEFNIIKKYPDTSNNNVFVDSNIQLSYNFYVINQVIKEKNIIASHYDHVVILRSDLFFTINIHNFLLSSDKICIFKGLGGGQFWGGYWIHATILPPHILEIWCDSLFMYQYDFFEGSEGDNWEGEHVKIMMKHDLVKKIYAYDVNIFFITADGPGEVTTWGQIMYDSENNTYYKYGEIYSEAIKIEKDIKYNLSEVIPYVVSAKHTNYNILLKPLSLHQTHLNMFKEEENCVYDKNPNVLLMIVLCVCLVLVLYLKFFKRST